MSSPVSLQADASAQGIALERVYYMSAYTILACERTNLPLLVPRVWTTSAGNAYTHGIGAIGGCVEAIRPLRCPVPGPAAMLLPRAARSSSRGISPFMGQPWPCSTLKQWVSAQDEENWVHETACPVWTSVRARSCGPVRVDRAAH